MRNSKTKSSTASNANNAITRQKNVHKTEKCSCHNVNMDNNNMDKSEIK